MAIQREVLELHHEADRLSLSPRVRYNTPANMGNETKLAPAPDQDLKPDLDPAFVDNAFNAVLEYLKSHDPVREPVRAQRIREVFDGRENDLVPLSALSAPFSHLRNPENQFRTAVSWLNQLFAELDIDLEVDRVSTYRLVRPSSK